MKTNKSPFFIFWAFFLLTCFGAKAQNSDPVALLKKDKSPQWHQLTSINGIIISYKYQECHDLQNGIHNENVLFTIQNTAAIPLAVEYDQVMWYNNKCYNCDGNTENQHRKLEIAAGETIEGSCDDKKMHIFSKMLNNPDVSVLTNFSIRNIQVKAL